MAKALKKNVDTVVKDLGLADFGRKEIELAEHEMPGLMAVRAEYSKTKPLSRQGDERWSLTWSWPWSWPSEQVKTSLTL